MQIHLNQFINAAVANSQEILKESKSTKLELVNKLIVKDEINKIIIPEVMAGYNDALAQKKTCEQIIENLKKDNGETNTNLVNKYNIKIVESNDNSLAKDLKKRLAMKFPNQITHKESYSSNRSVVCIAKTEQSN